MNARAAAVLVALVALPARGEEWKLYRPTTSGPFITFTAPITAPGKWLTQPLGSFGFATSAFDGSGALVPLDATVTSAPLTLFTEVGITERFSLGAQVGGVLNRDGRATSAGFLDTQLFARGVVAFEKSWPEVTWLTMLELPTGRPGVTGSGTADLTLGLDLTAGLRPFMVHIDLFFVHAFPVEQGAAETNAVAWSASVEWPFWPERLGLMVEVSGRHTVSGPLNHELIAGAGVELLFSPQVQALVGFQRTVWGLNANAMNVFALTVAPVWF